VTVDDHDSAEARVENGSAEIVQHRIIGGKGYRKGATEWHVMISQTEPHGRSDHDRKIGRERRCHSLAYLTAQKIIDARRKMGAMLLCRGYRQKHDRVPFGERAQSFRCQLIPGSPGHRAFSTESSRQAFI
jgi:hypothetical protein